MFRKRISTRSKNSTERVLKAGTIIMDQGQTGREAYVLLEGSATIKRNGKRLVLQKLGLSLVNCHSLTTVLAQLQ